MKTRYRAELAERQRLERFLARLQQAISEGPSSPDLDTTLHAVAAAARRAVDAKFVSVLVRDKEGVGQGALEGDIGHDTPDRATDVIAEILRDPSTSPSGIVLTTGERVVVPMIADDPRFGRWIPETERQGFTSTIAVPLSPADSQGSPGSLGVLAAYFSSPDRVTADTVELLTAYSEHASLIVLRAMAYEHERQAAQRLAEADAMKSELVSTIAHELRTPLTSIKGFTETVLRHWDRLADEERQHYLARVSKHADVLASLIDQVLDYASLEAGSVVTASGPVDLNDEATRIVETFHGDQLDDDHPIEFDLAPVAWARADRGGLERVLTNLLSNAAKYSESGRPIVVSTSVDGDEIVLSVRDQGIGIPAAERERIFDRFHRVHRGTGPRGSGIGLAIVKRYAELMGGRVWVESTEGKGSTFFFAMPAVQEPSDLRTMNVPVAWDTTSSSRRTHAST